jgi:hypothetical protein
VTAVTFRLGLRSRTPTFLNVRLAIEGGGLRSLDTGAVVRLQRRHHLDLPEELPGPSPR